MRKKRLITAISAAVLCAFSLFCSRSDVITGAGGGVVSDMDPSLTDIGGFVRADLGAGAADSAFSLPAAADPLWSTQLVTSGRVPVGLNADGDTVTSHTQWRAAPFSAGTGAHPYGAEDSLVGAFIYFRAVDTVSSSEPVAVFRSETLMGVRPVDRSVADSAENDEAGAAEGGARIGEFVLSGAGAVDSIELDPAEARAIFNARVSSDTSMAFQFAYSVVNYHGAMRITGVPYVIARVVKRAGGGEVRDSLPGAARFTVFESAAEERAAFPYSSSQTKRTAVFMINARRIMDTLSLRGLPAAEAELINAVTAVRYRRAGGDDADAESAPEGGGYGPETKNPGNYKLIALDTLVTDEAHLDSAAAASMRLLWNEFASAASTAPASETSNVHSIKAALRGAFQRHADSGGDAGNTVLPIYVYLRPASENSMMLWEAPSMVETIFTHSRQRESNQTQ